MLFRSPLVLDRHLAARERDVGQQPLLDLVSDALVGALILDAAVGTNDEGLRPRVRPAEQVFASVKERYAPMAQRPTSVRALSLEYRAATLVFSALRIVFLFSSICLAISATCSRGKVPLPAWMTKSRIALAAFIFLEISIISI